MAILSRTVVGALIAAAATAPPAPAGSAQGPRAAERAIKAAFLYNFTKYVEWPSTAFDGPEEPFRVCVFADAAFEREIGDILKGETVNGRPLEIVVANASREAVRCQLVYFGEGESERVARTLPSVRQLPVLTVGEGSRFIQQGGIIAFVIEHNRVRFDVSRRSAERAGLSISSQLLRVARNVSETQ